MIMNSNGTKILKKSIAFNPHFFYQIKKPINTLDKIIIYDQPFTIFNYNNTYNVLNDVCPHQSASLSKGWINPRGNIHCPYHGFEFDKFGHFCGIPDSMNSVIMSIKNSGKRHLSTHPIFHFHDDLYVCPSTNISNIIDHSLPLPHYPPEHFNNEFVKTTGSMIIDKAQKFITENVLDMLHISYVHSFGNREFPLPYDISFSKINEMSGRSIFKYRPFKYTISNQVGGTPIVIVENEYHLPTTTITRVIAGSVIKTVMTRATPITKDKTLFFWSVYRNFWCSKHFPILTMLGDLLMNFLMNKTLEEDINILKNVYNDANVGTIITKYDVTIQQYRKALKKSIESLNKN